MAIQWSVPVDLAGGLSGGAYVIETTAGGKQFANPYGSYTKEQPTVTASSIRVFMHHYKQMSAGA